MRIIIVGVFSAVKDLTFAKVFQQWTHAAENGNSLFLAASGVRRVADRCDHRVKSL